jgi:hypothetical protein
MYLCMVLWYRTYDIIGHNTDLTRNILLVHKLGVLNERTVPEQDPSPFVPTSKRAEICSSKSLATFHICQSARSARLAQSRLALTLLYYHYVLYCTYGKSCTVPTLLTHDLDTRGARVYIYYTRRHGQCDCDC